MKMSESSRPIGSVATSARAGAGPDALDLVGERRQQRPLDLRAVAHRLVEGDAGEADGVDDDATPSLQAGHELGAEPGGEERRRRARQRAAIAEHDGAPAQREPQDRPVDGA